MIIMTIGIILIIFIGDSKYHYSEITCLYKINDSLNEIPILGNEYENYEQSILNLFINETKVEYTKKYKFSKEGIYQIKYILNEKIYMNNMFKNIDSFLRCFQIQVIKYYQCKVYLKGV